MKRDQCGMKVGVYVDWRKSALKLQTPIPERVFKHNTVKTPANKGVFKYKILQIRQLDMPDLKRRHSREGGNPSQFNVQLIVVNIDR